MTHDAHTAAVDPGLAAVLGATVGVGGTLGTGLLAYAAARRQARDHGRVDHSLRLREERKAAYLAFQTAIGKPAREYQKSEREVREYWGGGGEEPDWGELANKLKRLTESFIDEELEDVAAAVQIAGPGDMGELAKGVIKELRAGVAYLRWICLNPNILTGEVVDENYQMSMTLHYAVSDYINQALGVLGQPPR